MPSAAMMAPPAPFITFYSFKGGVGRSMALSNVAGILAGRGFRVLVIDFDLEAPGISYVLRRQAPQLPPRPGLVDLFEDAVRRGDAADLFKCTPDEVVDAYTHPYTLPPELIHNSEGEFRVLPAGRLDEHYQRRLDELDLGGLYREGSGQPLIQEFKKIIGDAARFDVVLVDSRTGFSDESGICTRDLADHVVVVTGLNHQNIEGTAAFLRALREATGGKRDPLFVLSPVPFGEDELMEQREKAASETFTAAWQRPVDLTARIYYYPRLALTEDLHVLRSSRGPLYDAYAVLERHVRTLVGLTEQSLYDDVAEAIRGRQFGEALERSRVLAKLDDTGTSLGNLIELHWAQLKDIPDGEVLLGFLVEHQPQNANLHHIAVTLSRGLHPLAARAYERALERFPADAGILGNFALFLQNVGKDFDGAEMYYRKVLDAKPSHANHIGNFAVFLQNVRKDVEGAEMCYRRALEAEPRHANNLGNFAVFLQDVRKDVEGAETCYRRALEADPNHANNLGNFARFLQNVRKDAEGAGTYYRRALEADPNHAYNLGNFALFLQSVREDIDGAETYYRRSLDANPNHAGVLGAFALFLHNYRRNFEGAETYYRRALNVNPNDASNLGNLAQFLFAQDRRDEAYRFLERAFASVLPGEEAVLCELHFYAYTHGKERWPDALASLKRLLTGGARSPGWDLQANVQRARDSGHPEPELVAALADVVSDATPLATLDAFAAWQQAE